MRKYLPLFLIGLLSLGLYLGYPVFREQIGNNVKSSTSTVASSQQKTETSPEEITSDPLIHPEGEYAAQLSPSLVIALSNKERRLQGLPQLTSNRQLAAAAQAKIKDMISRQYFEHVSPDGKGPSYIIEQAGYKYIVVGENLALGNFEDNEALIKAWMDSPGHRANILNNRFTEIGVAVGEGTYNGKKTWFAVQEFGLPASSCPVVDSSLKSRIDVDTIRADNISVELIDLQQKLRTMPRSTADEETAYRKEVEYYNSLVTQYNKLAAEIKANIDDYNRAVRSYNQCIESD
jgi:uncharacterized protein YkwD